MLPQGKAVSVSFVFDVNTGFRVHKKGQKRVFGFCPFAVWCSSLSVESKTTHCKQIFPQKLENISTILSLTSVLISYIIKNTYKYILIVNILYIVFHLLFYGLSNSATQKRIYFSSASVLVFSRSRRSKLPL